jgi:Fe-S cluster assembly protein SufD
MAPFLDAIGPRAGLLVLRDGAVAHVELDGAGARSGVTMGRLADAPAGAGLLGTVAGEPDAFVVLNAALCDPVLVVVPDGAVVEAPLVVVHWLGTDGAATFPRTVVQVGAGAAATVVEVAASADVSGFVAPVTELSVGDAGSLRHVTVQQLGPRVWQTAYQASKVGQQASLMATTVALGGRYARVRTDSRLVGAGATGKLLAVYFGDGDQMHDFRTLQDHDAPRSNSDLLFKGAVAGTAHSVYSGLIRVRKGAVGTNAFQTNRNLVLSEGARADSVPNLEIEENDVRCSHASAVGPVDEEQRYYLETRGVPGDVAERLIVLGFLGDVIERVPVAGLRAHLRNVLAARLDAAETDRLAAAPAATAVP